MVNPDNWKLMLPVVALLPALFLPFPWDALMWASTCVAVWLYFKRD